MSCNFNKVIAFLFGVMLLPSLGYSQLADTPWPTEGQNARHTSFSSNMGPDVNDVVWNYTVNEPIINSPIVGYNHIFFTTADTVYAIEKKQGSLSWKYAIPTSDTVQTGMTLSADGTLFFGSQKGMIYGLNTEKQSLQWTFKTGGAINAVPTLGNDGNLYFGSEDSVLYAIDATSGRIDWRFEADAPIPATPAISLEGRLIQKVGNQLHSIDTTTGQPVWSFELEESSWMHTVPVVDSTGTIYATTLDERLLAISKQGEVKWEYASKNLLSLPSIGPGGSIFITSDHTIALDSADGTKKWNIDQQLITSISIDAEGTLYGLLEDGWGEEVNAFTQDELKWRFQPDKKVLNKPPIIGNNGVLYLTERLFFVPTSQEDNNESTENNGYNIYAIGNSEQVGMTNDPTVVPEKVKLKPNYPNPFNPTTTIEYALPQAAHVEITVYNAMGRQVAKLVNKRKQAGRHSLQFDASHLSSGIYTYRIKAGQYTKAGQMLLAK